MKTRRKMYTDILIIVTILLSRTGIAAGLAGLQCTDWEGNPVPSGQQFVPKSDDPCYECTCEDGFPAMCTSVLCSAPECEKPKEPVAVAGECCKFTCVAPRQPDNTEDGVNKTIAILPEYTDTVEAMDSANLGLKLVASTVTSFLILALLLFMVHRLRQRRLLIMMRRMHAAREEDAVAYMAQFDQVDMMGIEFPPYEEPPPPYTPPKPPDYMNGEAPPPYTPENNNNEGEGRIPLRPAGGSFMRGAPGARTLHGEMPVVPSTLTALRPGTSSRGTSTLWAPGAASSSAEVPQANSDVMTPESESDASYGFSVSYVNQPSPSSNARVIIRLQNHNPPTANNNANNASNATNDGDSGNNQANNNESSTEDTPVKKSNPQMQFIKRSSSVEIKRGSNSPRNSYVAVCDGSPSPRKQQLTESSTPTSSCSQNADSPTLERSPLLKCEQSTPPGSADVSVTWTRGSKPFRIPPSGSAGGGATNGSSPDGRENTATCGAPTRRSPPQTLPIIPVTSTGGAISGSDQNYTHGESSQAQPRKQNGVFSLPKSRPSVSSPLSPTGGVQVMPRSGSVASQVSQFSVCSETGEKKRPKFSVVPIAISNDSPYPVSPVSCNSVDPVVPGTSGPPGPHAQNSVDSSSGVSSTASDGISSQTPSSSSLSSGSSAVSSPLVESDTLMASATSPSASDSASQLDSRGSTLDRAKTRRRSGHALTPTLTSSAVTNRDVVDLSAINNNYVLSSSIIEEPQQAENASSRNSHRAGGGGQSAERSHSGRSGVGSADGRTTAAGSERPTVKKVKERKRRSKENGGVGVVSLSGETVTPARVSYVGGGTANDSRTSDSSDKHSRRPPKGRDASAPKFKQYGFIDDPELLTNRDMSSTSAPSHHPAKSVHRQNSKEKLSKDHRHSSRDKSKSRESSRERERRKRSGSSDRNVHKLDNDVIVAQRETQNTLDNAAFVNRDATESRNNKHGERRKHLGDHVTSSSLERRRKRRSTGDRTFPDSQSQGQGHKHSKTAPALNGYHDNEDIVIVDNDDDVFISNHSNKAVDNKQHYPTKHRGTRTNRHSVPNLDNGRMMQLDR